MKRLSIKVRKDGEIEIVTSNVPSLGTIEMLFSALKDHGVTIDTPSPNPALQLILCG